MITDLYGKEIDLSTPSSVVAGSAAVHKDILALIG